MTLSATETPQLGSVKYTPRRRRRTRVATVIPHGALGIWGIVILVPMLFVLWLSFKSLTGIISQPFSPPPSPDWQNYSTAWTSGNLLTYIINTIVIAVSAVVIILLLSSLAAFAISRFRFKGDQALYLFFLAGLALPIQIIALPIFVLMRQLNLLDNLLSLVLVYSAGGLAFGIFLLVNFMRNIPRELEDAAYVDGASALQVYWRVVMPLVRPALSIVAIFNFLTAWNGFFFPLILINNPHRMPVPLGILQFAGVYLSQYNLMFAALVIVSIPTLVAFIVVSRQFRRNMLAGGLKM